MAIIKDDKILSELIPTQLDALRAVIPVLDIKRNSPGYAIDADKMDTVFACTNIHTPVDSVWFYIIRLSFNNAQDFTQLAIPYYDNIDGVYIRHGNSSSIGKWRRIGG